jgi:hypothetical protein
VYRALASKFIDGNPLGPFSFEGRRRGDDNDRIPHQHRRELRGYRVFSAYLNHTDSRQANTFDSFMTTGPEEKGYVLHYLIDFGSTLGSGTILHKNKVHLDDYYFNYGKVAASTLSLGGYVPDWEKAHDPEMLSVGLYESKSFNPEKWRPPYPNPAFQAMTPRDAFWAAKILMRISDEHLAAAVEEGQYGDPQVKKYLLKTLIERRDRTARAWFSKVNPLDNFEMTPLGSGVRIRFDDLMVLHGLDPSRSVNYLYRIKQDGLTPWRRTAKPWIDISGDIIGRMKSGKPYYLQVRTKRDHEKEWSPLIELVLQKEDEVKILGLARYYRTAQDP